jgi:hypothetical protein
MKGMGLPMRWFLARSAREAWFGRPTAVFDTRLPGEQRRTGSAAVKLGRMLRRMGALPLVPPESFFVTGVRGPLKAGELARATLWGRRLHLCERVTAEDD